LKWFSPSLAVFLLLILSFNTVAEASPEDPLGENVRENPGGIDPGEERMKLTPPRTVGHLNDTTDSPASPAGGSELLEASTGGGDAQPLGGSHPGTGTVQDGQVAVTNDNVYDILLDVPGLGLVYDLGSPSYPYKLRISATYGEVVEWAIWFFGYYQQDYIPYGSSVDIDFPSQQSFMISISRPEASKHAWTFCRESSYVLSCNTLRGGSIAYLCDTTSQLLLGVGGLGEVRDTGILDCSTNDHWFRILSEPSSTVEWSVWHNGYYVQGYVQYGNFVDVLVPHYKIFIVTIWRYGEMGWLFCRINDMKAICSTLEDGSLAITSNSQIDYIVYAQSLADVRDTGVPSQTNRVNVRANAPESLGFQWSLWYEYLYDGSTTTLFNADIDFPRYFSLMITVHLNDNIAWLLCRENDGRLGCSTTTMVTYDMNRNQKWRGLDSIPGGGVDYQMLMDRAGLWDSGDSGRGDYTTYSASYSLGIFVSRLSGSNGDSQGQFICTVDGVDNGAVVSVTSETPSWRYCGIWGGGTAVGFRNVDDEPIGVTWYYNSQLKVEDDIDTGHAMRLLYGGVPLREWSLFEIEWRGVDSYSLYEKPSNPDWNIGIHNHAVFAVFGGDASYSYIKLPDTDWVDVRIYSRPLLAPGDLDLYIDGVKRGSLRLVVSVWQWGSLGGFHQVMGSGEHEIRIRGTGDDFALSYVRLLY
jgi:hypothetical protein